MFSNRLAYFVVHSSIARESFRHTFVFPLSQESLIGITANPPGSLIVGYEHRGTKYINSLYRVPAASLGS